MVFYAFFSILALIVLGATVKKPKGSVYLHIFFLTIPLIVRSAPVVLTIEQRRRRGICCDRYKRTKKQLPHGLHSPACRKRATND